MEGIYKIEDIDEGIALSFASRIDRGQIYTPSFRYAYINEFFDKDYKNIIFWNALNLFRYTLKTQYKKEVNYIWVTRVLTDEEQTEEL